MTDIRQETINSLFESMSAVKRSMFSRLQAYSKDSPISNTQLELLTAIKHLQPISSSHLAQQFHLTPGAVSQLTEVLESNELIVRERDQNDRRIQHLRLTSLGLQQLQSAEQQRRSVMEQVMQDLSTEELVTWLHIQQKLLTKITDTTKQATKESK